MEARYIRRMLLKDRIAFRSDAHMPSNFPTRDEFETYLPDIDVSDLVSAYQCTTEGEHDNEPI